MLELIGLGEANRVVGHLRVEVPQQRIALLHQPVAIAVGYAQHAAQHAHRQLLGDQLGVVEQLGACRFQHHVARKSPNAFFVGVDLAATERLADQPAVAGVLGRVVFQHVAT